jgi:hypothetical protein
LGLVHARLAMGWPVPEAFGLVPHADRRGRLDGPVRYAGQAIWALRDAAGAPSIATLRSRRHRARLAGQPGHDLSQPRPRRPGRRPLPRLPHPHRPGGGRWMSARVFAEQAGLPVSTVLHRLHGLIRAGHEVARVPDATLIARLTAPATDRRTVLRAQLPDGTWLAGGHRELTRQVLSEARLQAQRTEPLSESGLRRRLRLLPPQPGNAAVLHALGLGPPPDV